MMLACTPTVSHDVVAVAGLDEHPGHGVGAVGGVDDAHPVVDQLELGELRVDAGASAVAQRVVERVDRAVALADGDHAARRRPRPSRSPRTSALPSVCASPCASTMTRHDSTLEEVRLRRPRPRRAAAARTTRRPPRRCSPRLQLLDLVGDPAEQLGVAGQVVAELATLELDATRGRPCRRPASACRCRPARGPRAGRASGRPGPRWRAARPCARTRRRRRRAGGCTAARWRPRRPRARPGSPRRSRPSGSTGRARLSSRLATTVRMSALPVRSP